MYENVMTMVRAGGKSIAFSWKHGRAMFVTRLLLSVVLSILSYGLIYTSGLILNKVQFAVTNHLTGDPIIVLYTSGILLAVMLFFVVILATRYISSYASLMKGTLTQALRFANQREIQEHRATLDIACIRSKEYDDLEHQINDLPNNWNSRISFSEEIFGLLSTVVQFITFGTSLLWYNKWYFVVILVTGLPMIFVEFGIVNKWWKLSEDLRPQNKKRNMLTKPYHGYTMFTQAQMFNQLPTLRKQIDIMVSDVMVVYDDTRRSIFRKRFLTNTLTVVGLCVVILHYTYKIISVGGGIGTLMIVIGTARSFQGSIEYIVSLVADQWTTSKGVMLIEDKFFGLKPSLVTEYPVVLPKDITPEIVFDNVGFTYPGSDKPVLSGVSFTIKPGSKVAIVGPSGNGKSTLLALLMRIYDPSVGKITVNGISLRNVRPTDWNDVASCLTQEYAVLERKIGEEIASSRLDEPIDYQRLEDSIKFASFSDVVDSDSNGLDSQIGVEFGGRDFSGGEKQRLALARVHYRGTPVLVLDEPDSRLDPVNAEIVMNNLLSIKDMTLIIITHHVGRAEKCDHIIVMGKGTVAEQGTHEELLALNGEYKKLCDKNRETHLGVRS